jgi:hypothetical protein
MWLRRLFAPRPEPEPDEDPDAEENVRALRRQALTMTAADAGVAQSAVHEEVWCVLMETGYPEAVATLVTFGGGTTSLYLSNGGGMVGAGAHASVRIAAEALLAAAERHLGAFTPSMESPLPAVGRVRFYVRTFEWGTLTAEGDPRELVDGGHPLAPVYLAGQAVLGAVREIAGKRKP